VHVFVLLLHTTFACSLPAAYASWRKKAFKQGASQTKIQSACQNPPVSHSGCQNRQVVQTADAMPHAKLLIQPFDGCLIICCFLDLQHKQ